MFEIISLIISIVLGLPGIIVFLLQKKTELVYLENKQINVQEDLLKNFKDLSIKYEGQEIKSNLTFIKGYILCDGDKDISSKDNFIELLCPSNTKWMDFKILSSSKGLTTSSLFKDDSAKIYFDLFKAQENFEFEGIIEKNITSDKKDIKLSFFHRIPNIRSVATLKTVDLKNSKFVLLISTLLLLLGLTMLSTDYTIDDYNLKIIDAKTQIELDRFNYYNSNSYNKTIDSLKQETNGILLYFKPSKNYQIEYENLNTQKLGYEKVKNIIYFKKEISIIYILFNFLGLLLIFMATVFYFYCFNLIRKKKYLRYIDNI